MPRSEEDSKDIGSADDGSTLSRAVSAAEAKHFRKAYICERIPSSPRCEIQASLERAQPWLTWWWRNCRGGYRRPGDAHRVPAEFSEKLPPGCCWNLLGVSIIQYPSCYCQLYTAETI